MAAEQRSTESGEGGARDEQRYVPDRKPRLVIDYRSQQRRENRNRKSEGP